MFKFVPVSRKVRSSFLMMCSTFLSAMPSEPCRSLHPDRRVANGENAIQTEIFDGAMENSLMRTTSSETRLRSGCQNSWWMTGSIAKMSYEAICSALGKSELNSHLTTPLHTRMEDNGSTPIRLCQRYSEVNILRDNFSGCLLEHCRGHVLWFLAKQKQYLRFYSVLLRNVSENIFAVRREDFYESYSFVSITISDRFTA